MDYIGPQMKRLTQLKKGEFAFVVDLRDPIVCLEMLDNGFFPGEKVDVLENMPDDNHILVAMNNKHYLIIKNKANSIITNVVSYDIHLN